MALVIVFDYLGSTAVCILLGEFLESAAHLTESYLCSDPIWMLKSATDFMELTCFSLSKLMVCASVPSDMISGS